MNSVRSARLPPPVQLQFEDNRLLPSLYGEHDRNLARIEAQLGRFAGHAAAIASRSPALAAPWKVARAALTPFRTAEARPRGRISRRSMPRIRMARGAATGHDGPCVRAIATARFRCEPASALDLAALARPRRRICARMHEHDLVFGLARPAPARPISRWPWRSPC